MEGLCKGGDTDIVVDGDHAVAAPNAATAGPCALGRGNLASQVVYEIEERHNELRMDVCYRICTTVQLVLCSHVLLVLI